MARFSLAAIVCTALLPLTAQSAQPTIKLPAGITQVTSVEGINEYALSNGLHVLMLSDPSKPTTTVNMTVKVGSRYEGYGETGMAHLLEHLMFKGTPKHGAVWGEFTKRGLRANGSTSWDRTNYFASMAQSDQNLDWYMHWLGDALVNSYIARKDLDSEMTVVRNEMESGENDPSRILLERVMSAAYEWHSYGKQPIGARSDVENVSIPHLQAFYHKWYQPDNVVLIVTGKFDEAKTLALVASSFGAIPKPKRELEKTYTIDPSQDGERLVTLRRTGDTPILLSAYHIPAGSSPKFADAELACIILGGPEFRLYRALVEKGLAADADGGPESLQEPGLAFFEATLKSDQPVEPAKEALVNTVETVATQPFTQAELDRAKNIYARQFDQTVNDPERLGVALSEYIALGDWRLAFFRRDGVKAAQLADVNQFALDYFVQSNRTVGVFLPTATPVRAPLPVRVDVAAEMKNFKGSVAVASGEAFDVSAENLAKRIAVGNFKNQIRYSLLTKQTRGNKVIATFNLELGDEKSLFGKETIGDMTASMLARGTERLSREQLASEFEKLQTSWSVGGSATSVTGQVQTTRENLKASMALITEVLRHPRFDPSELEQLRTQAIAGIESGKTEPQTLLSERIGRTGNPYPKGDLRYVETSDEALAEVRSVTIEQIKSFYHDFYGATDAVFAAVGDFDANQVKADVEGDFGDWISPAKFTRIPRPFVPVAGENFRIDVKDKQNAMLLSQLGFPLRAEDREYQALVLGTRIVGDGGGRLWNRIRDKGGLSYSVGAFVSGGQFNANAQFGAYAIFAPQNATKVRTAMDEEIARAARDGFTAEELQHAKEAIKAEIDLGRAQDRSLTPSLILITERGLTPDYFGKIQALRESITLDEVNAAFKKYIVPSQFVIGVAGDFSGKATEGMPAK